MIFENVDKKLKNLGFMKSEEFGTGVSYYKHAGTFVHKVDIYKKESGNHLIISYQHGLNQVSMHNAVGLTSEEIRLFMKKYKKMIKKYHWNKKEDL